MNRQVLVVGYRPQIVDRLHRLGIPFVVWHDRSIKRKTIAGCQQLVDGVPFAGSIPTIKQMLARLFPPDTRFSHVIAGTEAAVVTASVARRTFGSRKSRDTVVLRCHNKRLMKEFLFNRGFPLIPFVYAADKCDAPITARQLIDQLGLPIVIKQLGKSGGRGMVLARCEGDIEPYLTQRVIFEEYIDAPEVSVETFISGHNIQFTSMTQYVEKTLVNLVPSGHAESINSRVTELHRRILMALQIEWGLTHAEYYIAKDQIYFGEIAIRPPGGYILDLISLAYEFNAWDAFVDNELGLSPSFNATPTQSAAAVLFHPGPGRIELITGVETIDLDPNCRRLHFYKAPGEHLGPREGISDAAAFALFCSPSPTETLKSVRQAQRELNFRVR